MQRLIKRLENTDSWYVLSVYLDNKFIKDVFIDYLKLLDRDSKKMRRHIENYKGANDSDENNTNKIKNSKALISLSLKKLITSYIKRKKSEIIKANIVPQINNGGERDETSTDSD